MHSIYNAAFKWIRREIYFIIIIMSVTLCSLLVDFMLAYHIHTYINLAKNTHLSPATHSNSTNAKTKTSATGRRRKKCAESNIHRTVFVHILLVNRVIRDALEFYCPEYGF